MGAVVGAVAGVLFAPDEGDKTRSKLVESTKKLSENNGHENREELIATTLKAIDKGFEKITKIIDTNKKEGNGKPKQS